MSDCSWNNLFVIIAIVAVVSMLCYLSLFTWDTQLLEGREGVCSCV